MAILLCIETATTNCSVALAKDGHLLASKEDYGKKFSHAERLHVYMEELLKDTKLSWNDLDGIAISKGPGSYTGLRIGVSAAKGLCFSLSIPLLSVSTLQSLAQQGLHRDAVVVPMLDARRMEVYAEIFSADGAKLRETKAEVLTEDSYAEYVEQDILFIGTGAAKFQELSRHKKATFLEALPSAKDMVALATQKFQSETFEDVAYFEPYYLKDFIAG
ncbi:tRNA (adenosine(37)-N6)-threonylcarbamoyltransferase complex dimerization subunit type 1 TsaB [Altibacter sp. HG106]|uniref:tRNA (adenosine(37)-N6)-threonylcarbamoyltransferase complex dimerization subunit type 1 TsaB n=1 Tax=Altibacter sp. HG106 TaxID=3023937 RepID=UPI002350A94D|nr:tRNA (adenosine(37)-N6)-threonylcarbamoyltransferase complex dimerization subunit type 1 TsaB [Altibacter sp. HG106]MDC7994636.1 tRNA (adenosine(37)-N6)-threonylcarbamoyltransferase complex dimerization subunit type 1 TsaB [Altibacter sp. HG106]